MVSIEIGGEVLDMDSKTKFPYTIKSLDLKNPSKSYMNHSKNFSVPATAKNNRLLGYFNDTTTVGGYDPFTGIEAALFNDNELESTGIIRVLELRKSNGLDTSYNLQFYSELTSFKDTLAAVNINALDYSGWAHASDVASVRDYLEGQLIPNANDVTAPSMSYPLISTKKILAFVNSGYKNFKDGVGFLGQSGNSDDPHSVMFDEFRPALNLSWIMRECFNVAGLEIDNKLELNPLYNSLSIWFNNGADFNILGTTSTSQPIGSLSIRDGQPATYIEFVKNVSDELDAMQADGSFKAPFTDSFSFDINIPSQQNGGLELKMYKNGVFSQTVLLTDGFSGTLSFVNMALVTNDVIHFEAERSLVPDNSFLSWFQSSNSLIIKSLNVSDLAFKPSRFCPSMSAVDLLKSILAMFNAFLIHDPASNTYTIEQRESYFASGNSLDLTKYIDLTDEVFEPSDKFKAVHLMHSESSFRSNVFYKDATASEYGSHVESTNSIFGLDFTVETGFNLGYFKPIVTTANGVPPVASGYHTCNAVDKSFSEVTDKPLLLVNNESIISSSNWYIHPYSNGSSQSGNKQIDYSSINNALNTSISFTPITGVNGSDWVDSNLYTSNWFEFFIKLYNGEIRHRNLKAVLPKHIVGQIKPNTIIVVEGERYLLKELTTDLNSELTTLKLITNIDL